jgi:peptidyl-prolyl cis-trans isomerase C
VTDRTTLAGPMAFRSIAGALLLSCALAAAPLPALAQDAPAAPAVEAPAAPVSPDAVVATVGEETITEGDIAFAAEDLRQQLSQMPAEEQRPFLVNILIDMKVMAKAAREQQMDQTETFKRRLQYLEEQALRRAYFVESIAAGVTPDAVQKAYDAFVAAFKPQEEVHARHILVATKEDADAIKAELAAGKPFEQLATEKSTDPSGAQNGGDLGFFSRGMMVKQFEDAAFALTEPGQVSEPVESQFGWHIIRLEEKRQTQPPTLEEVGPQLQQQVMFQAFEDAVSALKQDIAIDIPDPALAEGVKKQSEQQTP